MGFLIAPVAASLTFGGESYALNVLMALATRQPMPGVNIGTWTTLFAVCLAVFWLLTLLVGGALLIFIGDRIACSIRWSILAGCIVAAPASTLIVLFEVGEAISEDRGQILTLNGLLGGLWAIFVIVAGAFGGMVFWFVQALRNPQLSSRAAQAS